jgi:hypothetical protein
MVRISASTSCSVRGRPVESAPRKRIFSGTTASMNSSSDR